MSSLIAHIAEADEELSGLAGQNFEETVSHGAARREEERTHALRLLNADRSEQPFALPILATAGDVREAVQYLRKKPSGVSVVEALGDVKRRVFEARKIAAYEFWGIVSRQAGDRLHLTQLGWEFARKLAPETEAYRTTLERTAPYRAALEWISSESLDLVTHRDVAAYWQKFSFTGPAPNEKMIEAAVVCFFHLCQAAELGTVTIGKRGQPARLRVEREELDAFVEGRAATQSNASDSVETAPPNFASPLEKVVAPVAATSESVRFLIACGARTQTLSRLQAMLELLEIEHRTALSSEADAFPFDDEMFAAMRECSAALVVVTPDDYHTDETGACALNPNAIHLINTCFVLYDRRVALLWDKRVPSPFKLSSMLTFTLDGDDLTWDAGVKLMRVVKDFQEQARTGVSRTH